MQQGSRQTLNLGQLVRLWRLLFVLLLLYPLQPSATLQAQTPTPVSPPLFSNQRGFYSSPFQLTLSAQAGATIRYTTNGATPSPSSGTVYNTPILISATTPVRAIAYTSATNKSVVVTHSYLFINQVRNQSNTPPAGWPTEFAANISRNDSVGPFPADYEMDPDIVNHANYTGKIEGALQTIPSLLISTDLPNLFDPAYGIYYNPNEKDGDPDSRADPLNNKWERPISLEWINTDGSSGFNIDGGLRIHGQASRRPKNTPKHSMRVSFKAKYGAPKLDFALFDFSDPVAKFDRLVLRNGGNRSWSYWDRDQRREADYVNDEWSRRTWLQMGHLTARGRHVHLYINGLYWGLYNIAERLDEKFFQAYLGGLETDYDYIVADEDVGDIPVASAGTLDAFNKLIALFGGNVPLSATLPISNSTYLQISQKMDMVDFADYLLHTHYIGKTDWPNHNWNLYRKRTGNDTRFRWATWDDDSGLNDVKQRWDRPNAPLDDPLSPSWMFLQLITNPEFKQLFADRIFKHVVSPDGVLTSANCINVYTKLTNIVDQPVIAESARWGDYTRDVYHRLDAEKSWPAYLYSRDLLPTDPLNHTGASGFYTDTLKKSWVQVRDNKISSYCPNRSNNLLGHYITDGLYQTTLVPPSYAQRGGALASGVTLTISNPNTAGRGDIYYTTDGSDPRTLGGALSPQATQGGDAVSLPITQVTLLRSRVLSGTLWSPLIEYTFYPPQAFNNLVINEIHYNPIITGGTGGTGGTGLENPDDFEFIELFNRGNTPLRLDNVKFSRGFSYQFPVNTALAAGAYLVLASNAVQFKTRYGVDSFAEIRGNLSNGGEAIELHDAVDNLIDSVDYLDLAPWPTTPDGGGASLSLCNASEDNSPAVNWAASTQTHGTPGQANNVSCTGITTNIPPIVSITSPVTGTSFTVGTLVTITANASDADGTLTQVQFLRNGEPIAGCVDSSAPYQCTLTPGLGSQRLSAIASDQVGASTQSAPVVITITQPAATPTPQPTASSTVTPTAQSTSTASPTLTPTPVVDPPTSVEAVIEENGQVVIEAEQFSKQEARSNHAWQQAEATSGLSGNAPNSILDKVILDTVSGKAMVALPNDGMKINKNISSNSAEMQYPISFTLQGTYTVWMRVWAASESDNSAYLGIDGRVMGAINVAHTQNWMWVKQSLVVSQPGLHKLSIWMREDGLQVDRFVLTLQNGFQPTGIGPAASASKAIIANLTNDSQPASDPSLPDVAATLQITLTQLTANQLFTVGTAILLQAEASSDPRLETQVHFLVDDVPVDACDVTSAPYECSWSPVVGDYQVRAVAQDDEQEATSSEVLIHVKEITADPGMNQRVFLPMARRN